MPGVAQLADPKGLAAAIEDARGQGLDWLVIDTPPRADGTAGAVACASDLVFVPVLPGVFDVRAIRPRWSRFTGPGRTPGPACC